jgi:hypothetical protein
VDIQSVGVAAYTSQLGTAGGAAQGASITDLAQQGGVSRDSLEQLADRSVDPDRGAFTRLRAPASTQEDR